MSRSLAVRPECIKKVKLAFKRSGIPRQQDLAEELGLSPNTVNSFLNGKGINRLSFIEICEKLSLDWHDIADLGDSSSEISVTVKVASEVEIACVSDGVTPHQPPQESASEKRVVGIETIRTVPLWIGRDELLQELKERLLAPATTLKVLALVGQGGIGKTSLAAKLLEAVGTNLTAATLAADSPYNSVLCFKAEDGSSFDEVAGLLLRGLEMEASESVKEAGEKINLILTGLRKQRTILLLDNLETILHPASHPQAGKAVTPEWGKLLNACAYGNHCSQVILTSREIPADLADLRYPDSEPDGDLVAIVTVAGVAVAAAMEILRRKLKDSEADLRWIAERVGGHLFLLNQLGSLGKDKPGYLRKHPELVTRKAEPMLREQLARQSEAARDLLVRMCVLRVGIDIRGLTFLRLYTDDWEKDSRFEIAAELEEPAELTEVEIRETQVILEGLLDSSLVQSRYEEQQAEDFYDLHRLIVEFLQGEYQAELPKLLESVYKFYSSRKNVDNPKTLEDLRPVLEAQHFAFQLGNYREAANLIRYNLEDYLKRWGYWSLLKDLYEQILPYVDEEDRDRWLRQIGGIYRDTGEWDLAEKYFQEALEIAQKKESKSGMATSWGMLGDIEGNRGNWDEAERLYRQSLVVRTELGDRAGMATSWGLLGYIEGKRGNWDEAERLYRQSLAVETELGDRAGMATSWGLLGYIERNRGNWDEAERLYRQSLAVRTELGNRAGMAEIWASLGGIEGKRGNWDEAERLYRQCLAVRTELGDRAGMAEIWGLLGGIEGNRGNWDEAERLCRQSLVVRTELGDRAGMAETSGALGDIEGNRGNWDEAERLYRQCLAVETELGDRTGMASSWGLLGYIEGNRGNWDEAERLYRQCLAVRTELGNRAGMATSWGLLGDIERNRGNWDEAERLYRQSLAVRTELGDRADMAISIGGLGETELGRGNLDAAEKLLKEALTTMQELGMTWHIAETNYRLFQLERQRGNTQQAQQHYETADQIFQQLGAAKDLEKIESEWNV